MLDAILLSLLIAFLITGSFILVYIVVLGVMRIFQRVFRARKYPAECTVEAVIESKEIVKSGAEKAQQIISDAQFFNKDIRRVFENSLDQMMKKQLTSFEQLSHQVLDTYKKSLDEEKRLNQQTLLSGTAAIKEEIISEIRLFEDNLRKETLGSQEMVEQRIKQEYEKLQQELKQYRAQQLQKVDENLYKVVSNATEKIIGEAVDLHDKETIVIKCLEEAKKEGLFNS